MNIIFTVCNRTSLTNAIALGTSVMKYPEHIFYLCWVDTVALTNLPENIRLIDVTKLALPEWKQMANQYHDFELVAACRPWFAKHLINLHPEQNTFVFLAPTVALYQSPEEIIRLSGDLLLTPNITKPIKEKASLDDKRILNIGMFHSGAWVLRPSEESLKFLDWWCERTIDRAEFNLCNGMCLDQLWLNFCLVHVPKTVQISYSGWHYGLHAVLNREITEKQGSYFVNGVPLISIDFAGLDFFDPVWSDYADLISKSNLFKKMHTNYKHSIRQFRSLLSETATPGYGRSPQIKSNRLFRKKLAVKIQSITRFIDQF
ncbi:hypothetical protein [Dyadobacter psychrotolerans]|uniref:Glycosyl transferase n=1 Tax=Dyadobacter psychrotolerans TaxID=2541721 RepID=A0A4R5DQC0_9BACT|nr:hypothetical protein [Dyadobacter psychrotolerans]TDE16562.1 hypothetical protein E0F88_10015 [Dyadobacter psychrotolerans]